LDHSVKVIPISSSQLIGNDDGYVIEQVTGYTMHPYEFGAGGDPDKQVTPIDELHEAAGRQCYESWPRPNPSTATNSGYLGNILTQQHYSVTEHGCITMWCDGWSRNMLLELERHQHHNFLGLSVISTRYVPMDGKSVVIPPVFNELPAPDAFLRLIDESRSSRLKPASTSA
jgi:thymidylate synthase ThyX